jgi:hypothetical protein
MGKRTILCIWLGVVLFSARTLFPPWVAKVDNPRDVKGEYPLWAAPLNDPPTLSGERVDSGGEFSVSVDYGRLLLELAATESFVLALYFTWARPKETGKG